MERNFYISLGVLGFWGFWGFGDFKDGGMED